MSQPENYYNYVNDLITISEAKKIWTSICSGLFFTRNPVPDDELQNQECLVDYGRFHIENLAWTACLVLMSWTLNNFQNKMTNGHCWNPAHPHGERTPRDCELGRNFHRDMFNRCLQSYRDLLNTFETQPQV